MESKYSINKSRATSNWHGFGKPEWVCLVYLNPIGCESSTTAGPLAHLPISVFILVVKEYEKEREREKQN